MVSGLDQKLHPGFKNLVMKDPVFAWKTSITGIVLDGYTEILMCCFLIYLDKLNSLEVECGGSPQKLFVGCSSK